MCLVDCLLKTAEIVLDVCNARGQPLKILEQNQTTSVIDPDYS